MAKKTHTKVGKRPSTPVTDQGHDSAASTAVTGSTDIVERPDGYYWLARDGKLEFGPYETYELALREYEASSEEALAPEETLHSTEREMGLGDWIDPQTGTLAEGGSPPHIEEE